MRRWLLSLVAISFVGCAGDGDDTAGTGDTGWCADVPVQTWDNFGAGFLTENCQTCHASTSVNRYEAPEEVFFDSYDDAMVYADRILARTLAEDDTMPPQGGVTDEDKTKLEYWLVCEEGF